MPIPTNKDIAEVTYNGVTIPLAESGGGESNLYTAEYGVTTYAEIVDAYDAGKLVKCHRHTDSYEIIYELAQLLPTEARFGCSSNTNVIYYATCKNTDAWTTTSSTLELSSRKVNAITASSTATQYPSAKAVYDLVQSSSGGGGDNVFNVEYGVTPIEDIKGAYDAGKVCQMIYDDSVYYLVFMLDSGTQCYFTSPKQNGIFDVVYVSALHGYQALTQRLQKQAISDQGNYFTADTVEGALQEIGAALSGLGTLLGSGVIS